LAAQQNSICYEYQALYKSATGSHPGLDERESGIVNLMSAVSIPNSASFWTVAERVSALPLILTRVQSAAIIL